MKQLSSSELNSMSKEELAAVVLQMQQLQKQMQQEKLQLQQQIHTLNEKIAIMNARHFGRSTEKLETLSGQMNIFNEAEVAAAEAIAEPAIEQVVVRLNIPSFESRQSGRREPRFLFPGATFSRDQSTRIIGLRAIRSSYDPISSDPQAPQPGNQPAEHCA